MFRTHILSPLTGKLSLRKWNQRASIMPIIVLIKHLHRQQRRSDMLSYICLLFFLLFFLAPFIRLFRACSGIGLCLGLYWCIHHEFEIKSIRLISLLHKACTFFQCHLLWWIKSPLASQGVRLLMRRILYIWISKVFFHRILVASPDSSWECLY